MLPMSEHAMPRWIPADKTIFRKRLLDLTPVTHTITAWTEDPEMAQRAISWRQGFEQVPHEVLFKDPVTQSCQLQYPILKPFERGYLFLPESMDEKWVLFFTGEQIWAIRSWSGRVEATADVHIEASSMHVTQLQHEADWDIGEIGSVVDIFDWLMRSHAFNESLPLPCTEHSLKQLEAEPLSVFSQFGSKAEVAALGWSPPPIRRALGSDGAVVLAVINADLERLKELIKQGATLDGPCSFQGYSPLMIALVKDDPELLECLLEGGADVDFEAERGMRAAGLAIVHSQAPIDRLEALAARGADLSFANSDGFGLLHAAAETNKGEVVNWLVERGLGLEGATERGLTALHIAAALGHLNAAEALVKAGAQVQAKSDMGTPLEIAQSEQRALMIHYLENL